MEEYKKICIALLVGAMFASLFFITSFKNESSLPPIDPNEKWGDFNNIDARIRFCQAMGYEYGSATRYPSMYDPTPEYNKVSVDGRIFEYVENPDDALILCKRQITEKKTFEYEDYKRWLLNLELNKR